MEIRVPKYKSIISKSAGKVVSIEEKEDEILVDIKPTEIKEKKPKDDESSSAKVSADKGKKKTSKKTNKKEEINLFTYSLNKNARMLVGKGDEVSPGDRISEGSIDVRELMEVAGKRKAEEYIINEVQKIYISEGVGINNKHLEVIVRQMFSKEVKIKESGESSFFPGDIISRKKFIKENSSLKAEGKKIAKAMVWPLSITRTALASESFFSAASFQETTRVIVSAATEGQIDNLTGLKENVIIGRKIPSGTGFKGDSDN